jgi:glyoxylase-like metal-dependent hydrolase (beta-lactamase superfamily II)/rhodanese-related sulfurtransferase
LVEVAEEEPGMIFRQYQLSCLSLFSYLIGDEGTGRAVVVDPQRDVSGYLADAEAFGLRIERVIETHFHADFLSGHLELAAATGAVVSYGSAARTDFPMESLADGERLSLGDVVLEIRHTPGHTPESISIVIWERAEDDEPWGVLTGDTMFIGDVGRPDLLSSAGWTADDLAGRLYHSLRDQLLTLPDPTRVYPAHGAGSACGKAMSDAVTSTIGEQRETNYALRPMAEDEFVAVVTEGQSVAPPYFAFAADANRHEHQLLDDSVAPEPVTLDRALDVVDAGGVVLDARPPAEFASGHLRGAINVGLEGRFAEYAGDVIRPDQPIVVVADGDRGKEARVRLARIGFDRVAGELVDVERALLEHPELAERSRRLSATEVGGLRASAAGLQLVDIRNPGELEEGVIEGAVRIPLAQLLDRVGELDPRAPTVVYCASGYRSSIGASLLRSQGFDSVADLQGGFAAWRSAGLPVVAPVAAEPATPSGS